MTRRTIFFSLALGLAMGIAACQSAPQEAPAPEAKTESTNTDGGGFTMCQVPRPQACTKEYAPVCAHLADGSMSTRSNACTACSDISIFGHRPGACR